MHFLPLGEIQLADRQRKLFRLEKIIELADDIRKNGLLHAPVIRPDNPVLVAGERRLRAIEMIYDTEGQFMYGGQPVPFGMVPVVRAHARDDIGWAEAELSENLIRQDLTWQERAQAMLLLNDLRKKQNPAHTVNDTFEEARAINPGIPHDAILREELTLASHLSDPDVAAQKTRQDAMRILRRKAQLNRAAELAQQFAVSAQSQSPHTPYHANALELLPELAAQQFDVLLTDPPYGINAQDFGSFNILGHEYDDSPDSWARLMEALATESYRLCKPSAHAYVFCDISNWSHLRRIMTASGWSVWPRPMIWNKGNGMLSRPDYGPRYTYEAILFASKGDKRVTAIGRPDVLFHQVPITNRIHGAEKPVPLYIDLLSRSTMPGDSVLDPFMGSGTIFPAANSCRLRATGVELNRDYFNVAVSRLEDDQ